ncbi:hypothetical protein CDAR_23581 [Caerostris darwini]|uniref:Uncharacterized protein n=1 Tax=Caerostris darwini TaxID=1538125 RepID=A0AAV4S609_9ARAC|nr:hypothetical protein CDAR_23581 [Caerostris darwini]
MQASSIKSFSKICPEYPQRVGVVNCFRTSKPIVLCPKVREFLFGNKEPFIRGKRKLKTWTTTRALEHFKSVPSSPSSRLHSSLKRNAGGRNFTMRSFPVGAPELFKELISRGALPWFVRKGQYLKGTLQVRSPWEEQWCRKETSKLPLLGCRGCLEKNS